MIGRIEETSASSKPDPRLDPTRLKKAFNDINTEPAPLVPGAAAMGWTNPVAEPMLNGDSSYFNRGFHVITMRWGKVYSLDVFEDSQEVARGLAAQAECGLKEAVAQQIVS